MNFLKAEINAGAEKPFDIIHISDTHLSLADSRDSERKIKLAERRRTGFPEAEEMLQETKRLAELTGNTVIHTGDLIDFVSEANLDRAEKFTSEVDCFAAAGNHEFSLYVGEAKEDAAYRQQSLAHVSESFTNDIRFASRVINGVDFVALDNSYYLIEPFQLEALKKEVAKGLPVILCVHTPLYTKELFDYVTAGHEKGYPAYLMSVPEDRIKYYPPDRYEQQREDVTTREAYEYIKNESGIKAILAGHVHTDFAFDFFSRPQLGVGCTDIRTVTIL